MSIVGFLFYFIFIFLYVYILLHQIIEKKKNEEEVSNNIKVYEILVCVFIFFIND